MWQKSLKKCGKKLRKRLKNVAKNSSNVAKSVFKCGKNYLKMWQKSASLIIMQIILIILNNFKCNRRTRFTRFRKHSFFFKFIFSFFYSNSKPYKKLSYSNYLYKKKSNPVSQLSYSKKDKFKYENK